MLAREFAAIGHRVTFLTSQYGEFTFPFRKELRDGVLLISFPDIVPRLLRKGGLGLLNIVLRTTYVLFHKYDIVYSDSGHRPSSGLACIVNRAVVGAKYVSEWWDYFGKGGMCDDQPLWYRLTLGNYDTWAEVFNKKIADGVVALSRFTRDRAMRIRIRDDRILVLHGGADTRPIKFVPSGNQKVRFGFTLKSLTFGISGINEHEIKDVEPFIIALNGLKSKYDINWFSTGTVLKKETRTRYGLGDEYHEFGWLDYSRYAELLSCADVFVMLLRDNAVNKARWPNKLGDYFAAGRPILANAVGEVGHYMKMFPQSFIPVEWDRVSVERAIIGLLRHRAVLPELNVKVRKVAEGVLSWEAKTRKLERFYYEILS